LVTLLNIISLVSAVCTSARYIQAFFHMLEPINIDFKELQDIKNKIGDTFKEIDDNFK